MIQRFALLIGAMKAGTTALYRYLEQHPELAACPTKEPWFLGDPARWGEGLEAYERLWPAFDPARHRWALEASTGYSKLPLRANAVQASWALEAEFRFLYLVRDPLARIRSHYLHALSQDWMRYPLHERLAPEAVLFSNYRFQLQPYVTVHGRDAVLVLSYEEFRRRPRPVLRSICRFLGIDEEFSFQDPGPQNSSDGYRARLLARLVNARGVLPTPLDLDACERLPKGALRAELADRLVPLDALDLLAEVEYELERSITPTPEHVELLHELLDEDLARFRDEWGIDPWGGGASGSSLAAELERTPSLVR